MAVRLSVAISSATTGQPHPPVYDVFVRGYVADIHSNSSYLSALNSYLKNKAALLLGRDNLMWFSEPTLAVRARYCAPSLHLTVPILLYCTGG